MALRHLLKNKFISSSLFVFLGITFSRAIGFGSHIILTRTFAPSVFGTITVGLTILTFSARIGDLGLIQSITRFLPRADDIKEKSGFLLSGIELLLFSSLAVVCFVLITAPYMAKAIFQNAELIPIIRIFILILPLQLLMEVCVGGIRGTMQTLPKVISKDVILPLSRIILIFSSIVIGLGELGIAAAYAISYAIAGGFALYYIIREVPFYKYRNVPRQYNQLLRYSLPLLVSGATSLFVTDLDILLLTYYTNVGSVGVYKAVYPLALLLNMVLMSVGYLLMPAISDLHSDEKFDEMRKMFTIAAKWTTCFSLPIFLLLISYPSIIIQTFFGAEYSSGAPVLVILAIGFLSDSIAGPNGDALKSVGRTDLAMYNSLGLAAVNLILNIILIPEFGIVGAAVATSTAYILGNVVIGLLLYNEIKTTPFSIKMFVILFSGILIYYTVYKILSGLFGRSFYILVTNILFFGIIYLTLLIKYGGIIDDTEILQEMLS